MSESSKVDGGGVEHGEYFAEKAAELIAPLLHAAALADKPIGWRRTAHSVA